MQAFKSAKWIWVESKNSPNTYGEFYSEFFYNGGAAKCRLSADSDYTLFINGRFVESNQFGDYEWFKSYDEIESRRI